MSKNIRTKSAENSMEQKHLYGKYAQRTINADIDKDMTNRCLKIAELKAEIKG